MDQGEKRKRKRKGEAENHHPSKGRRKKKKRKEKTKRIVKQSMRKLRALLPKVPSENRGNRRSKRSKKTQKKVPHSFTVPALCEPGRQRVFSHIPDIPVLDKIQCTALEQCQDPFPLKEKLALYP